MRVPWCVALYPWFAQFLLVKHACVLKTPQHTIGVSEWGEQE